MHHWSLLSGDECVGASIGGMDANSGCVGFTRGVGAGSMCAGDGSGCVGAEGSLLDP